MKFILLILCLFLLTSCNSNIEDKNGTTIHFKSFQVENVEDFDESKIPYFGSSAIEEMKEIESIFIQPAANDGGISLGAAIKGSIDLGDDVDIEMIPYLGPEYSQEEIEQALLQRQYNYTRYDNIEPVIAKLLSQNQIVANFQGRIELGPRALGNRSLLANPEQYDMLIRMNNLKGREIGYVLNKDYWGKGIMSEAVACVIDYCFKELQFDFLCCGYFLENSRSKRVNEKMRFTFYKNVIHRTRYGVDKKTVLNVLYNNSE